MLVACWDLEGPISIIDFAAEIGRLLSKKSELNLEKYDMGEFFVMVSNYDDYLIDVPGVKEKLNIPEYQPGDTLRLMAPFYVACFTDEELMILAKQNLGLLPGCKELMAILQKNWEIFIISTSYTHFAHNVTRALNIPKDNVYCTDLNVKKLKEGLSNINEAADILVKEIFQKYITNNKDLTCVLDDLNDFFWKGDESDYVRVMNNVLVRGGKRKELAVEEISEKTRVPISEMIALGDSITDIDMLKRLNEEGGLAITFNGNRFSAKNANIAVTTPNNLGVLPIFQFKDNIDEFLENWEIKSHKFKDNPQEIHKNLISNECEQLFMEHNFVPELVNLKNKTEEQKKVIISRQEKMRKIVRGWAGVLG